MACHATLRLNQKHLRLLVLVFFLKNGGFINLCLLNFLKLKFSDSTALTPTEMKSNWFHVVLELKPLQPLHTALLSLCHTIHAPCNQNTKVFKKGKKKKRMWFVKTPQELKDTANNISEILLTDRNLTNSKDCWLVSFPRSKFNIFQSFTEVSFSGVHCHFQPFSHWVRDVYVSFLLVIRILICPLYLHDHYKIFSSS